MLMLDQHCEGLWQFSHLPSTHSARHQSARQEGL